MTLTAGTYVMVTAKNTSRAVDVSAGSDSRGANVQIWTRHGGHSQTVTVTGSGTNQVIRFPLTGKVLDVSNGQAKNGNNVHQWDANNTKAQAWNIVPDNRSVTIGSTSYPTYVVKTNINQGYVLDLSGGNVSAGTNIQVYQANGTDAQRWAFIPMQLLPTGTYRLLSALNQKVCVSSANAKDGSNVQIAGLDNADNKQIWQITSNGNATYIQNIESNCYLTALKNTSGGNVVQKTKANGAYSRWLTRQAGSQKYNGATFPLVEMRLEAGQEMALDVTGGKSAIGTNIEIYSTNDSNAQRFLAVPAAPYDKNVPAPSALGFANDIGKGRVYNIWGRGATKAFPCWVCSYSDYQMRYRYRTRKATAGDNTFSAWSAWMNIADNSKANDGWGTLNKKSVTPTLKADPSGTKLRYVKAFVHTVNTTGNDLVEIQYETRAMGKKWAGNSATFTGRIKYKPIMTLQGFTWTPDGRNIKYTSDQKRNNNDTVIYKMTCVSNGQTKTIYDGGDTGYTATDIGWDDTALLPQKYVKYIPNEGDTVTAVVRFLNVDGAYNTAKQTVSGTVSYGSGKGMTINPTIAYTAGKMLSINANTTGTEYHAWIDYYDDKKGFVKYKDEDGKWNIPIVFNQPFRVFVIVKNVTRWDVHSQVMEALAPSDSYLFNFETSSGAQDYFQVKVNVDDAPVFGRAIQADYEAHLTNGNNYEVVHFGRGRAETINVEGVKPLVLNVPNSDVSKAEALFNAHYAWLRTPKDNTAYRVSVVGLDIGYQAANYTTIRLDIKRVDNPSDY